ncbi:L-cystine transporter [Zymobacter palmae]|uniref:Predicted Na+/dicarboxylate symporter n=1 Tax=Zymobacter palmae TaxID=33074 RepID=A0A348HBK5_9GAMM|nr:L-cystine transporter [Zymobacter palmae]BBG29007.1 predicted Na+/dicarboxylate symporter [Zymobacter palmae]
MLIILYCLIFLLLIYGLYRCQRSGLTLGRQVLIALVVGVLYGAGLQALHGADSPIIKDTLAWVGVVGSGYVSLLQMIVMPLIMVSILGAIARLNDARALGRISLSVLAMLMITVAISAAIGIGIAHVFGLTAQGLADNAQAFARGQALVAKAGQLGDQSVPQMLVSFIPSNPFAALTGASPTAIISVVIFSAFLGGAALMLRRDEPEAGERLMAGIQLVQAWILRLVRIVIRLTPYGVMALMVHMVAVSHWQQILELVRFLVASYIGLALILVVHAVFLLLSGISPKRFFGRAWPVLSFAFTSRSSAASIPLSIETQTERMGIAPAIANFAATFGSTIGQNGCAGLYPAMLATMIAPTVGIDPMTPSFFFTLVGVVAVSSFGIAGVGGGATFAAIVVLSTMNLPLALAGVLIAIEPLIDMGRTAVNVNGAMTAGAVSSRWLGMTRKVEED